MCGMMDHNTVSSFRSCVRALIFFASSPRKLFENIRVACDLRRYDDHHFNDVFWLQLYWGCLDNGKSLDSKVPLRWRHNGHDSVSNHQPHGCLLNRLFRCRSKKTSKLRVTGLCVGNSPGTGEFPAQMASDAENVSIWWRHHVMGPTWGPSGSDRTQVGSMLVQWTLVFGSALIWIRFDKQATRHYDKRR